MDPERCRTCLKQTDTSHNLISMYSNKHNLTFSYILKIITNIEISNENNSYTKRICISCEEFINSAYDFREMCNKSNEQLESYENFFEQPVEENEDSSEYAEESPHHPESPEIFGNSLVFF